MPERWKQRRGSLQLTSVTTTRLAPACQHWRTASATSSGLVLAACSGVRSQATFGDAVVVKPNVAWVRTPEQADEPAHSSQALQHMPHQFGRLAVLSHGHL